MSLVAGREFDREEVLARLHHHIMALYEALRCGEKAMLQSRYRSTMYRLGEMHPYALADGTIFEGIIRGVRPSGELQIEHSADGTLREYLFKQVELQYNKVVPLRKNRRCSGIYQVAENERRRKSVAYEGISLLLRLYE